MTIPPPWKINNLSVNYVFQPNNDRIYLHSPWQAWQNNPEFIIQLNTNWLPLWSNGQSSWLQIQRSEFDSRRYQIFWEVVGLEQGPLSLVSTIEELFGRKSSGSDLEIREYGRRDSSHWPRGTLYPRKLALTSPTSGGRSIGIVRSWTQATELVEHQL
jgi:hypothetical protein